MNNNRTLIAFDLDGTTLNRQGEISDFTVQALEKASRQGHVIAVATGRPMAIVPSFVKELSFVDYMITSGGAVVEEAKNGKKLAVLPLGIRQAKVITVMAKGAKAAVNLSGIDQHFLDGAALKIVTKRMKRLPFKKPSFKNLQDLRRSSVLTWNVQKALEGQITLLKLECLYPEEAVFLRHVRAFQKMEGIELAAGMGCTMEITAKGATKGAAVKLLGETLGIKRQQRIVFGDSGNDLSMRETAGTFVAVGNAADEIKKVADIVADSVENDGVGKALYSLLAL